MKRFDLEFNRLGQMHDASQLTRLLGGLHGVTDLLVVSHGWNKDMADARELYDKLLGNVDRLLAMRAHAHFTYLAPLAPRVFAACQVFWPSKKFTEDELIPGGGAASAENSGRSDVALETVLDRLAENPDRLGDRSSPSVHKELVSRAKELIPELERSESAGADLVSTLRKFLNPEHASHDDASIEFFSEEAATMFRHFEGEVIAPGAVAKGGATAADIGRVAGVRDMLKGARAAARRIANFATYYQMKARADIVGSIGVAQMIRRVREQLPTIKLHLVGHSFGGQLVTAAARSLPDNTPAVTVSLLQAAISHNGFSENFLDRERGFYRDVIAKKRASGPIIVTHTKNDRAVGIVYPLASRVAFQSLCALGDANDPYGGMGRNGALRTAEVSNTERTLKGAGQPYNFAQGAIYNLLADEFITNHGAVDGPEVAYAILSAARALR